MGFLNPSALLLAPLFVVLVVLYLWEQQRRRIDVPSLLLWEAVPDAVIRTSRFKPDLLFFLQLLLLSLLIAGFARPYFSAGANAATGERHIFILDTSASMQAREDGSERFEQARNAVLRKISRLSANDEAMLISAASYPRVLVPFTRDHAVLERTVRSLRPVDTGTQLEPALALARRAGTRTERPTRIELFTDIEPSRLSADWTDEVDVFQVGRTDDNLAIEGLEIFQGRFQDPSEASARVTVRNFSQRNKHGFLSIRLDGEVVRRRGFSLSAGELRSFTVNDLPGAGVVHATLEVDDALAVDNHAYGWVRPLQPIDLAIVSATSSLRDDLERIAQSVPNLHLRFLSPDDYENGAFSADAVLFNGYVPAAFPARASLFVFPARSGPWFSVAGHERLLPVLNWDERHPALGNLRPQLVFPLSDVRIVRLPDWTDVLLSSNWQGREVPLVFAGEHKGQRLAGISFDLAAERLLRADNVNLLLLFMNILDWLLPPESQVVIRRTDEVHTFRSPSDGVRRVIDPLGQITDSMPSEPLRVELSHAGEYRVETDRGERRLYANFVDPIESDINRGTERERIAPKPPTAQSPASPGQAPFDAWLYTVAAALFLVEWIVAVRT